MDNSEAQRWLGNAVELDPTFASAWATLGATHYLAARFGWSEAREPSIQKAAQFMQRALAIDDSLATAYGNLASVAMLTRQHERAAAYIDKALERNPTATDMFNCARNLNYLGKPREALELIKTAMRLNPYYPALYSYVVCNAYRLIGDYDQAISAFKAFRDGTPNSFLPYNMLAAAYGQAGRNEEGRAAVAEVLSRNPNYSLRRVARGSLDKDPTEVQKKVDVLRKLGMPE